MAVESRERWPTSRSWCVSRISASCTRWGNCVAANSAKAREKTDSLGHLAPPLPAADPPQHHIGVQPVQQHARRRQVVDRLGHEGPRHRRAILGRTPRHPAVPGNQVLDTDDLQGLHQLLLFPGQWPPTRVPTVETAHAGSTASRRRRRRALNSWLVDRSWNLPADLPPRSMSSSESMARGDPMPCVREAIRRAQGGTANARVSLPGQPPDPAG